MKTVIVIIGLSNQITKCYHDLETGIGLDRVRLQTSSFCIFCKYVYTETTILYKDFINEN